MAFAAGMPALGIAIWMVNLINGAFSFWHEYKAEKAAAALRRLLPRYARVMRDGDVRHPHNAWLFTAAMGVDVGLNQMDLMAHLIVEEMSLGDMMTLLKLRKGQYALVEEKLHPRSAAVGRAVCDLPLPAECVLSAVIRGGRLIIPHGHTVLTAGDEVLAVIHTSQAVQLATLLGKDSSRAL